jgi:hypothetical protein
MSAAIADETMTAATAALAGVAVSIDVSFALIIDPYPNDGIDSSPASRVDRERSPLLRADPQIELGQGQVWGKPRHSPLRI